MKPSLKNKLNKVLKAYKLRKEASTTGTMPVATGGVQMGGDAATTPFAFSKRGARPDTIKQGGYSQVKPINRSKNYKLENQMYSEPTYITPAQTIEPVTTYKDKFGLVQHNNPDIDPNLVSYKQGNMPMCEGFNGLKYEQEGQTIKQPTTIQPNAPSVQSPSSNVNVSTYEVLTDFTAFDQKLKSSTENFKNNLQKTIQDKVLGKKVVIRASKGFKQPEADYTVNVTGVNIDYYYDRYVIVILGREENKQKLAKFFIKPGFKIKILGNADNLKPKDRYQVSKSKALVQDKPSSSVTNTVTGDEEDTSPPPSTDNQNKPTQR